MTNSSATPRIYLAPMEGVVDWVMRELYSEIGGYDQMVTEFVRVTSQLLPPKVFYRYCPELHNGGRTRAGVPVFVQLLGSDLNALAENAAQAVELGAPGIDINFGCPAKTVNRHDGGAAILKDPSRIFPILSSVRKAIPSEIPLTAKVRLGYDHKDHCREIAAAVAKSGACRLTIHARTKIEGYKPPAHWHFIRDMREVCEKLGAKSNAEVCENLSAQSSGEVFKSIEVVANGDIWTVEDFNRCREITGCSSFALGRPAIANPFLAAQIREISMNANPIEQVHGDSSSAKEIAIPHWEGFKSTWLTKFIDESQSYRSEDYASARTKQWLKQLRRTYPPADQQFEKIKRFKTLPEIRANL